LSESATLDFVFTKGTVTPRSLSGSSSAWLPIRRLARKSLSSWRSPTHRAKRIQRILEELEGRVELFFLRDYSPELNLDEQVWEYLNSRLAVGAIASMGELKGQVRSLHSLQKLPHKIAAFSSHPEF